MKTEKVIYESPQTKKTPVNLESGICASSADVQNSDDPKNGQIQEHEVNTDFNFNFADQIWDQQ